MAGRRKEFRIIVRAISPREREKSREERKIVSGKKVRVNSIMLIRGPRECRANLAATRTLPSFARDF